jgi:hypothetical protein
MIVNVVRKMAASNFALTVFFTGSSHAGRLAFCLGQETYLSAINSAQGA